MRKPAWRARWSRSCAGAATSRSSTARWPTASATTGHGQAKPPPATWPTAAPSRASSAAGRAQALHERLVAGAVHGAHERRVLDALLEAAVRQPEAVYAGLAGDVEGLHELVALADLHRDLCRLGQVEHELLALLPHGTEGGRGGVRRRRRWRRRWRRSVSATAASTAASAARRAPLRAHAGPDPNLAGPRGSGLAVVLEASGGGKDDREVIAGGVGVRGVGGIGVECLRRAGIRCDRVIRARPVPVPG